MGLLDFLKKKSSKGKFIKVNIPEEDRKYYERDEYYTYIIAEGTPFQRDVVLFDERKKTAIPSKNGLYPAEILLLHYCSKGDYPRPKKGYPAFWWFSYGIRDVGAALKTLENRGFIYLTSVNNSLSGLTAQELKSLLKAKGLPTSGKKSELVERASQIIPEEDLKSAGIQPKYALTEIGQQELNENAYVPYMHSSSDKTTEDDTFGMTFNVWSINKLLGKGDKSNWKSVIEEEKRKKDKDVSDRNTKFMEELKPIDYEAYEEIKSQDEQLEAVKKADIAYKESKDLKAYICFWEKIWQQKDGLKFSGAKWNFKLADLYIKDKRYDDALSFVKRIKKERPTYSEKADLYIQKIKELESRR